MKRLSAACALLAMLSPHVAHAHGGAAAASTVLRLDGEAEGGQGPVSLVRLSEGLARRVGDDFAYLCPALWREELMGPADALASSAVFISTTAGLYALDDALALSPHGDGSGRGVALVRFGERLWELRADGDVSRVVEVTAQGVVERFADSPPWTSLSAAAGGLQLVRMLGGGLIEQRLLSFEGEERAQSSASAPTGTVEAFARMAGMQPYLVLLGPGGLTSSLQRFEVGALELLHDTPGQIVGPFELSSGERFIAVGGALARFEEERVEVLDASANVTCIDERQGRAYACSNGGVRALSADGLGASWFALSQLVAPDLSSVPAELVDSCDLQWRRFTIDLLAVGVDPRRPDAGVVDGGPDASPPVPDPQRPRRGGGCRIAGAGIAGAHWPLPGLALLLFGLAWAQRRTGRSR